MRRGVGGCLEGRREVWRGEGEWRGGGRCGKGDVGGEEGGVGR